MKLAFDQFFLRDDGSNHLIFLPSAYVVCGKVMLSVVSVCRFTMLEGWGQGQMTELEKFPMWYVGRGVYM